MGLVTNQPGYVDSLRPAATSSLWPCRTLVSDRTRTTTLWVIILC